MIIWFYIIWNFFYFFYFFLLFVILFVTDEQNVRLIKKELKLKSCLKVNF